MDNEEYSNVLIDALLDSLSIDDVSRKLF